MDPLWIYDGGSPGPWLCLDAQGTAMEAEPANRGGYTQVACEICGDVLDRGPEGNFKEARHHWETHVLPLAATFEFFLLPGAGCTKKKVRGTWASVFERHPSLIPEWKPVPPFAAAADMAAKGESSAGTGGGVEWPRGLFVQSDYQSVVEMMVANGHPTIDPPPEVEDETTYWAWSTSARVGCSIETALDWLRRANRGEVKVGLREWAERHGRP